MENLLTKSIILVDNQALTLKRSLVERIDWNDRLIGLIGARGTGKTTLLLQQIKFVHGTSKEAVYISLDDIYFSDNTLVDFATAFRQKGGKAMYIDEVHKYKNWAREIKNIYDFDRDMRIVFTGSSIIDILRENVDLSRRVIQYELTGLSFREYLEFAGIYTFPKYSLGDILSKADDISLETGRHIRPIQHFNDYIAKGYYPFFLENPSTYHLRIEQIINTTIENDMRFIEGFDPSYTPKLAQLLYILSANVPFKPNITKLSDKTGINRNTLVQYIHYLAKAKLINLLTASGKSISTLQKPDKIYLENTNLHVTLAPQRADRGAMRESFFLSQIKNAGHRVTLPLGGDFLVDETYTFEIGGKGKTGSQLQGIQNSYIAADDIEVSVYNKIPLWLFGFLY